MAQPLDIFAAKASFGNRVNLLEAQAVTDLASGYAAAWERLYASYRPLEARVLAARAAGQPVRPGDLFRMERFQGLMAEAESAFKELAAKGSAIANGTVGAALDFAVLDYRQGLAALQQAGVVMPAGGWDVTFDRDLALASLGYSDAGSPLNDLFQRFGADATKATRSALVGGIVAGKGTDIIARDLRRILGVGLWRSQLIARTEAHRAYREVGRQAVERNPDVFAGWMWRAACDLRTCAICWERHGTVYTKNEPMRSHPACRCALVPMPKTFADILGVPIPDPMRGLREKGPSLFAKLPPARQKAVLGPSRFKLFTEGYTLTDMVRMKPNKSWGPQPALVPLKDLKHHPGRGPAGARGQGVGIPSGRGAVGPLLAPAVAPRPPTAAVGARAGSRSGQRPAQMARVDGADVLHPPIPAGGREMNLDELRHQRFLADRGLPPLKWDAAVREWKVFAGPPARVPTWNRPPAARPIPNVPPARLPTPAQPIVAPAPPAGGARRVAQIAQEGPWLLPADRQALRAAGVRPMDKPEAERQRLQVVAGLPDLVWKPPVGVKPGDWALPPGQKRAGVAPGAVVAPARPVARARGWAGRQAAAAPTGGPRPMNTVEARVNARKIAAGQPRLEWDFLRKRWRSPRVIASTNRRMLAGLNTGRARLVRVPAALPVAARPVPRPMPAMPNPGLVARLGDPRHPRLTAALGLDVRVMNTVEWQRHLRKLAAGQPGLVWKGANQGWARQPHWGAPARGAGLAGVGAQARQPHVAPVALEPLPVTPPVVHAPGAKPNARSIEGMAPSVPSLPGTEPVLYKPDQRIIDELTTLPLTTHDFRHAGQGATSSETWGAWIGGKEGDPGARHVWVKPTSGNDPNVRRDIGPDGARHTKVETEREYAAQIVNKHLGYPLEHQISVIRDLPRVTDPTSGITSKGGRALVSDFIDPSRHDRTASLSGVPSERAHAALFDCLILNTDRHGGNFYSKKVGGSTHYIAIDPSLSFPIVNAQGATIRSGGQYWTNTSVPFTPELRGRMLTFLQSENALRFEMEPMLGIAAVDQMFMRAKWMWRHQRTMSNAELNDSAIWWE